MTVEDFLAAQNPADGKLRRSDAEVIGDQGELADDLDALRGDAFLDPAVILEGRAAALGNAVVVLARQDAVIQRAESGETDAEFTADRHEGCLPRAYGGKGCIAADPWWAGSVHIRGRCRRPA